MNKKFKKISAFILGTAMATFSAPAMAGNCDSETQKVQQALDKLGKKQTGGFQNSQKGDDYVDPDEQNVKDVLTNAAKSGCVNFSPSIGHTLANRRGDNGTIGSEYVPSAPMQANVSKDPTYDPDPNATNNSGALPISQ